MARKPPVSYTAMELGPPEPAPPEGPTPAVRGGVAAGLSARGSSDTAERSEPDAEGSLGPYHDLHPPGCRQSPEALCRRVNVDL
jgi:hypothetical protein